MIKRNIKIFIIKINDNNFDFLDYSINLIISLFIFKSCYNISKYSLIL